MHHIALEDVQHWDTLRFQRAFGAIVSARVFNFYDRAEVSIRNETSKLVFVKYFKVDCEYNLACATSWDYYAGRLQYLISVHVLNRSDDLYTSHL
jgi:hypothetical protein